MATEAETPEPLSIMKIDEEKDPTSRQFDKSVDKYCQEELKKVECIPNQPPETIKHPPSTDTMQGAIHLGVESNAGTLESEGFLELLSVANNAGKETCRISEHHQADEIQKQAEKEVSENITQLQKDQKFEGGEKMGSGGNEVMEARKEKAEKSNDSLDIASVIEHNLQKSMTEEPALKIVGEDILKNERILDQNVEIIEQQQAFPYVNARNTEEATSGSQKDEKQEINTDNSESSKQCLNIIEATSDQNKEALENTPDLTVMNRDVETVTGACGEEKNINNIVGTKTVHIQEQLEETIFKEEEDKKPKKSSNIAETENDLEAIKPSEKTTDEKYGRMQIPHDGTRGVSMSTLTGNPDIKNDEEATSVTRECAIDKIDSASAIIGDEIQGKNLDTPFVIQTEETFHKVKTPEVINKVSEIRPEDDVKESPKEAEEQAEIIEKTTQAYRNTSKQGKDGQQPEHKLEDSFTEHEMSTREDEGLETTEASARGSRNEEKFTVAVAEENASNTEIVKAEEHGKKETSKHEEKQNHSFLQHEELKKEKLQRSSNVISEMMETSASSEDSKTIACVKKERSIRIPEDSFKEMEKEDKPTDTDDISEHVIPKEKNISPVALNETIESADLEIPEKNVNDLQGNLLIVENEQLEHEKLDEVSKFEPQKQVNEANGAIEEKPNEGEKTEIVEKTVQADSNTSEQGKDGESPEQKLDSPFTEYEKSVNSDREGQTTAEASAGKKVHEEKFAVVVAEESISNAEIVEAAKNRIKETSEHEEKQDQTLLHQEPNKEEVQKSLNVIPEMMETPALSENAETITCIKEKRSTKNLEESFEDIKKEVKQTDCYDNGKPEIPKEKNFPPVDLNEKIKSEDLQIPEKNVNDLHVIDSLVEKTEQMEHKKLELQEQVNEPNEAVKESPNVEQQTEINEKIFQAHSTTSEPGEDSENPEQKPEESMQREGDRVPTTEASAEINRDEDKLTVVVAEENSSAENVESRENSEKDILIHEEEQDHIFRQHEEPEKEELQTPLNMISGMMEKPASSENVETITCVKEEKSITILEDSFEETEEGKPTDTGDISKHIITKEKNLPPGDLNEKIESEDLRIPERNVNDLLVTESLVEETEQEEHEKLDEISKFESKEQVNEYNETVKESPNKVEQQTEITEKFFQAHSIESGPSEDREKPEKSMQREDDRVPTTETSAGVNRDEDKLTVVVPEENSSAENVESQENIKKDTLKHEEEQDQRFLQHEEPEKERQRPLNMISEIMEKPTSSEHVETITCTEEERSIKILEDSFVETEEGKLTDTGDVSEHIITKEKNLPPVDFNKKIESEDLQTPEKNVNDLLVIDSLVEKTEQVENEKMDEISKFEPQQQNNEPNEAVKESLNEVEHQTEITEKICQAQSITSEPGEDSKNPEQKLAESIQREGDSVPTMEASAGISKDEEKLTVLVPEKNSSAEKVESRENSKKDTLKHEEQQDVSFLQHEELEKGELQRPLNVISEMMEKPASSENVETITCVKEEKSIKILEDSFEETEEEYKPTDTRDISEHIITKEKNLPPSDLNEKIETEGLRIPEKNVNDLLVIDSLVEETEQEEHERLDEISKFEPQEQVYEPNEAVEESPNEVEQQTETEKICQPHSIASEPGEDSDPGEDSEKPEESMQREDDKVPTTETSAGINRDEDKLTVAVPEENSSAENVKSRENSEKDILKHEEEQDQRFLQHEEPKKELQRPLNMISEMMGKPASSENVETIICVEEERTIKTLEDSFDETEEGKLTDTGDVSEHIITKEKNLPPVDFNEKIESEDLRTPEKNVNDLLVIDSLVEETEQVEHEKMDEISKFEPRQQVNEPNEAVKESPNEVEQQTEITEKICQAQSITSEPGEDSENPEQKPEESIQREGDRVPTTEASAGINRDEEKLNVVMPEENSSAEKVESRENSKKDTLKHEEQQDQSFLQHQEPEKEELQRPLNMISEMMEKPASGENVETITCVKEKKSTKILEDSFEETKEEDKPTDTGDISEHIITKAKNLPPVNLKEKTESEDTEIQEKNVNDLHVTDSLVEETEPKQDEKLDDSKFEPREKLNEANGASTEEEKKIEEKSAAGKSEESTTLEHTSTEGKATKDLISIPEQKDSEKLQYIGRLDFEEEEVKDVEENTEVEIKNNEAAFDTGMDNKPTKSDSTESLIEEDAPVNVCSTVREVDEKSSRVASHEKVAKELSGDDKNCKADGQINNIIDEEVHDEPKIRVTGEVTKEHIVEGNVRYILPDSNEEETAESFQYTEKKTEESKLEDTREQIIEEDNIDLPPESAKEGPVKNFKDDEKESEKLDKEILKESETAEAGDKNAHEKNQENEIPEKIFYTSPVKQKERLQGESEDLPPTDASGMEKKIEDRSSFMVTEDEDNITGLVEAKENSKKLEESLNMMSEETGVCVSNEDICLREEAAVENLEETLGEEMKEEEEEEEAKDIDGTKENGIAKEEDREQVTEAAEENKSPECTVLELNFQEKEIEVEPLKAGSELDSKGELEGMEVSENVEEEIVETNGDSREKSKIMEVAIANDNSTVYTGKTIELNCQEDENTQKSTEGAETKLKPGDRSYKTDNEIENLKEIYESSEIIGMEEDAAKRIIDEKCTVIDIAPQPIGEVTSKSSENDVKKEEKPKVETCEKHETTSLDDSNQKQNLEERGKTIEENSRVNEHVIQKEHTVTEISPESIEEETFKSSEEDVKEEKKPKVEMHEESEVTSVDESLQKQTLEEGNTIRNWSVGSAREETNEQSSTEDEHVILEEHIVTDSSPESTGEEKYKSSKGNEKNEEKPKVEKCAEFEKTIVDEGIQKQILEEENAIKSRYIEVDRAKTDEESFKKDKQVKQDEHTVTTISPNSIPEETFKSTEEEKEEGNLKVENLESAAPDEKLENSFESNAEDQCHNPLPKTSQTQIEKIKNITYQNTGDVGKRDMNEEVKPQMEAQDHKKKKNENETISDDILTDKVSRSPEADENENIKEQIIQEGSDTKELHETYVRDETDKEITEKKKAIDELHAVSLSEETIKKIPQDDEPKAEEYPGEKTNEIFIATKNEIQEEEVAEETEKTDSSNNIIENIAHDEERACAASSPVSVKKIIESLPSEARGKNVEEAAIKLNMENQEDTANTKDGKIEPMNLSREEQIEISRRETERSIDEAKIHSTICENEIRKTQDQTKADDLAPTQYSGLVISQNEGGMFHEKDKETTQEIQKPEETFGPISEKQAPREVDMSELTEMMVSSDNKGDLRAVQDLILKSIQKAEAKDLKLEIVSGTESDLIEEPNKESASINTEKISLPNLLQRSPKETLQKAGHVIEEKELTANKEEMKTEGTTLQLDEAKTDEEKDEEDGEEEHKKEDSGSDAPIMVEASKEMDVKVSHKKSHNILSGVGSKVKHSIAKVKKAIIGKSSHPKPSHPKPVSPKEMK